MFVVRVFLQVSLVELCVGDSWLEVSFGGGCEGGGWDGIGGSEKNVDGLVGVGGFDRCW